TEPDEEASLLPPNAFAQVRLTHKHGLAAEPARYEIAFTARSLRWAYLLVTDSNNATFDITGADSPFHAYSYQGDNPMSIDAVAVALAKQHAGKRVICLTSNDPVACQQVLRKSIKLKKDTEVLIKNLPNPKLSSIANLNEEMILYEV